MLFSYIAGYEFDLPSMDERRKLARVLWAVNDTIEAYKRLMSATEDLVRGQFAEGTIDKPFVVTEKSGMSIPRSELFLMKECCIISICTGIASNLKATALPSTTRKDLLQLWINILPYDLQQQFADFVHQADKSKSSLQKALTATRNISRKIISENL